MIGIHHQAGLSMLPLLLLLLIVVPQELLTHSNIHFACHALVASSTRSTSTSTTTTDKNSNANPYLSSIDPTDSQSTSTILFPPAEEESRTKKTPLPMLAPWQDYEYLRPLPLDNQYLTPFFQKRPQLIAQRLYQITKTLQQAQRDWNNYEKSTDDETTSREQTSSNDNEELRATQLCAAVASLGPVAVKVGQTLSQRPDIVGDQAALALKRLQTQNAPFDNALAFGILHQSLNYWKGPLAPNLNYNTTELGVPAEGPTLFAHMTPDPMACASLGQVYQATMHNEHQQEQSASASDTNNNTPPPPPRTVAVKVQRPDALSILAQDVTCFRIVLGARKLLEQAQSTWENTILAQQRKRRNNNQLDDGFTEAQVRGDGDFTTADVLDRVAREIKGELDYRQEAANAQHFQESLAFLGFVDTPTIVHATEQVLITEWVQGRHLNELTKEEGLALTRMAVQACTASMVLTGFVHADPHEGNLMLHDDGRVVFLDFGLMSTVDPDIMEGFARGIQALLQQDWKALTEAFVDVGFVTTPIYHRDNVNELWRSDTEKFGIEQLATELGEAMQNTDGGVSRFGALAEVLNKKISPTWLVFTPPYVLLLVRTFLTLEGMAATIDPEFNIYEMAMPWAIKRSLSPSTEKGVEVFRSTLLTKENKIQWDRILELANLNSDQDKQPASTSTAGEDEEDAIAKQEEQEAAKAAAMKEAIGSLMGSSDGRALRRMLKDLDSVDLLKRLSSRDARPLLQQFSEQVAEKRVLSKQKQSAETKPSTSEGGDAVAATDSEQRPVSSEYFQIKSNQQKWRKMVVRILLINHLKRCLLQWRGLKATVRLIAVGAKVFLKTLFQKWRHRNKNVPATAVE